MEDSRFGPALESHGYRVRDMMVRAMEPAGPTKFVITAGDERVCPACRKAEADGAIPVDQLYSNGMLHPSFHGKTCRCIESTSKELAQDLIVKVEGDTVEVMLASPSQAHAASLREYGSGNGPPNPAIREQLDDSLENVFSPFFKDLTKEYVNQFMNSR